MFLLILGDFDVELKVRRMLVTSTGSAGNASRARRDAATVGSDAAGVSMSHDHGRFRTVDPERTLVMKESDIRNASKIQ